MDAVLAWLDRILLSFARESVDRVAMAITAAALLVVALLLVYLALSPERRDTAPAGDDA